MPRTNAKSRGAGESGRWRAGSVHGPGSAEPETNPPVIGDNSAQAIRIGGRLRAVGSTPPKKAAVLLWGEVNPHSSHDNPHGLHCRRP